MIYRNSERLSYIITILLPDVVKIITYTIKQRTYVSQAVYMQGRSQDFLKGGARAP